MIHESSFSFTDLPDYVNVGKYSSIAANCIFHGSDNHYCVAHPESVTTYNKWGDFGKGSINIGNDVWIGNGVRILSGVTIGDGSIIGAGAVVTKNIDPYSLVVGNPAVVVRKRFPESIINKLLDIKWWNWDKEYLDENFDQLKDIKTFMEIYGK